MPSRHQVLCTKKDVSLLAAINKNRQVVGIGGVNEDGSRWYLPESDAIKGIKDGTWAFFVSDGRNVADVIVVKIAGREHLKTTGDTSLKNNLEHLPDCP